jgi:hypothetical protein
MKKLIALLTLLYCLQGLTAQTFFGFQTVGKNTFFFSLSWQNNEPLLGVGYNNRAFDGLLGAFTDYQAELRFPLHKMYDFKEMKLIAGAYAPTKFDNEFLGAGLHLRWERTAASGEQESAVYLAATVMPTVYYGNTMVTDQAFGTAGLRITAATALLAQKGDVTSSFSKHKIELGGHLDTHIDRSFSIGLDGYFSKKFGEVDEDEKGFELEGNFYLGTNYSLYRL